MRSAIAFSLVIVLGSLSYGTGSNAGAFSRMGFGPRGIGLGNAMSAVIIGDVASYYNPAVVPFIRSQYTSASFGILSHDRSLNFIQYAQPLPPFAGISAGLINSGVSNIDGRDSDGQQTGPLRTWENQFFLAFGIRLRSGIALGTGVKFYWNHLYTDVNATAVGVDIGILVPFSETFSIGGRIADINASYKWDTSTIYGRNGNNEVDDFPILYSLGASYSGLDTNLILSADIEASNKKTFVGKFGVEYTFVPEFSLRAGLDRVDFKEKGAGIRPGFGFSLRQNLSGWKPAVHYVLVQEPFAGSPMHLISLSVTF